MRQLRRNKRDLWYALNEGTQPNRDENGFLTGEYTLMFSEPVHLPCNVSAAVGQEAIQAFGGLTDYQRTVSVADTHCPMAEGSRVWFGVEPNEAADNYNYVVVRKADSKNSLLYALREVSSHA